MNNQKEECTQLICKKCRIDITDEELQQLKQDIEKIENSRELNGIINKD